MTHIESSEIKIDQSRMTVLVNDGSILAVPLTARVDTGTGEVTFHTDPASLTSADRTGQNNRREPSDPSTADDPSHGAVVAPSPTSLTHRDA